MAKEMECSEDPWVIRMILIDFWANPENSLPEIPGTPINPLPCKVSNAIC